MRDRVGRQRAPVADTGVPIWRIANATIHCVIESLAYDYDEVLINGICWKRCANRVLAAVLVHKLCPLPKLSQSYWRLGIAKAGSVDPKL